MIVKKNEAVVHPESWNSIGCPVRHIGIYLVSCLVLMFLPPMQDTALALAEMGSDRVIFMLGVGGAEAVEFLKDD